MADRYSMWRNADAVLGFLPDPPTLPIPSGGEGRGHPPRSPSGLTSRVVTTVAVDPFTGNPIHTIQSPPQGTKGARGDYPDPYNSLGEPWPGEYDQTVAQNGRVVDPYTIASNPPSEFSTAYVDGMGAPGANQGTGPATEAIETATYRPSFADRTWADVAPSKPLVWEDATPSAQVPQGADPWANNRVPGDVLNGAPPNPGMVMGSPKVTAALSSRVPEYANASPQVQAQMRAKLIGDTSTQPQQNTQAAYGASDADWQAFIRGGGGSGVQLKALMAKNKK